MTRRRERRGCGSIPISGDTAMLVLSTSEWLVLTAGVAAIVWVNWYFFLAGRANVVVATAPTAAAPTAAGSEMAAPLPTQVVITVDGGYSPSQLRVKAGQPLRVVFDRCTPNIGPRWEDRWTRDFPLPGLSEVSERSSGAHPSVVDDAATTARR